MKRLNILIASSILAALVMALVVSIPARADRPESYKEFYEEDGIDSACGFPMDYHMEYILKYSMWCNNGQELCGDTYQFSQFEYTITYAGRELAFHGYQKIHFTWITYEQTLIEASGASWIATIPGHGVVYGTTGKAAYLETCPPEGEPGECSLETLHWSGMVFDDPETICTYMATGE